MGHWESDTIRFSNKRKPSVTTLVDRETRLLILCKNIYSTSALVMNNIREAIQELPKKYCRTITFDQGADFAQVERHTPGKVFYA